MLHPRGLNQPQRGVTRPILLPFLPVAGIVIASTVSCHMRPKTVSTATVDQPPETRRSSEKVRDEPIESTDPKTSPIPEQAWSQGRWLRVITIDPRAPGGWAEGSFDPDKNKLIIVARDVRRFIIKTDMIHIDWDRRVILSLNHVNSELRHRAGGVLTFELDDHDKWIVLEPPARSRRD